MIYLAGSRVQLTADVPDSARSWRNDPAVSKWCRQYTLIDELSHDKWLVSLPGNPTIKMYGIAMADNTRIAVGVCGLTSINRVNQSAEFSCYIAKQYQAKGYGRDALRTLLWHGFNHHNLNRIWGETFDGNPALKMFEAIGMQREGTLRQSYFRDGKFIDSHIVSILRGEFRV